MRKILFKLSLLFLFINFVQNEDQNLSQMFMVCSPVYSIADLQKILQSAGNSLAFQIPINPIQKKPDLNQFSESILKDKQDAKLNLTNNIENLNNSTNQIFNKITSFNQNSDNLSKFNQTLNENLNKLTSLFENKTNVDILNSTTENKNLSSSLNQTENFINDKNLNQTENSTSFNDFKQENLTQVVIETTTEYITSTSSLPSTRPYVLHHTLKNFIKPSSKRFYPDKSFYFKSTSSFPVTTERSIKETSTKKTKLRSGLFSLFHPRNLNYNSIHKHKYNDGKNLSTQSSITKNQYTTYLTTTSTTTTSTESPFSKEKNSLKDILMVEKNDEIKILDKTDVKKIKDIKKPESLLEVASDSRFHVIDSEEKKDLKEIKSNKDESLKEEKNLKSDKTEEIVNEVEKKSAEIKIIGPLKLDEVFDDSLSNNENIENNSSKNPEMSSLKTSESFNNTDQAKEDKSILKETLINYDQIDNLDNKESKKYQIEISTVKNDVLVNFSNETGITEVNDMILNTTANSLVTTTELNSIEEKKDFQTPANLINKSDDLDKIINKDTSIKESLIIEAIKPEILSKKIIKFKTGNSVKENIESSTLKQSEQITTEQTLKKYETYEYPIRPF